MGTRWRRCALLGGLAAFLHPLAAGACGGATVSAVPGSIGTDAQRIFISARAATTEVVTQIIVPESTADYGVLIPAPAQPALDSVPVDEKDLEALDQATAPQIRIGVEGDSDDSGGCMCLPTTGGGGESGGPTTPIGVQLSEPVDIGPVTAVVMTGETPSAVNDWLQANGFALSEESGPIVDAYAGPGKYFIAIRRNAAVTDGPSSIGLHFTLPGDQRLVPLRFAAIGAARHVAFTVFVAARTVVAPSPPFRAATINDLDGPLLAQQGYAAAVSTFEDKHHQRAFVLEGTDSSYWLRTQSGVGPRLLGWLDDGATLTRLSARFLSASMKEDVTFATPYDGSIPNSRVIYVSSRLRPASAGSLLLAAVALTLRRARRRQR